MVEDRRRSGVDQGRTPRSGVVWIDDELCSEDPILGLTYQAIAEDAFEAADVDALLVVPHADRGITSQDLDEIEAFFGTAATSAGTPAVAEEMAPSPQAGAVASADLDWAATEADVAVPSAPEPDVEDPFAGPAPFAGTPDLLEDPFANSAPRKKFVPDEDDPFA